ncbi:MAG TPA: hypothetical protein VFF79_06895 [Conexibacter sp.]|jgi:hypothetical protein|nr:hypothetical protein [Conexibacter sp.]
MTAVGRTRALHGENGGRAAAGPQTARALSAAEIAWLAALPVAAITVLLIATLGPLVGDVLLPGSSVHFFDAALRELWPEPHEQGRFLVALTGPVLLAGATALLARRRPHLRAAVVEPLVWAAQTAVVAFAITCLAIQRGLVFAYPNYQPITKSYFTDATLTVSVLGAIAILAAVRSPRVRALAARCARETTPRRVGWTLAAALLIAIWLLHVVNTEHTVANESQPAAYHLQFTLDETFAVLDGRSPLVNFAAQYGSLWPYPVAGIMSLLGTSVGIFTGLMALVSGIALLAMYDVLRRVTRSSLTALLLFAPFLATSFFLLRGPLENRYTLATIFADYPLRFAGPWLLAWLTARHLDGERDGQDSRPWPLFVAAGLVVMNNVDHGVPALAAVLAALLWADPPRTWTRARSLALQATAGLVAAFALVSALTLVRAGALPDPALLVRYAKLFALAGYAMLPMPVLGMHTIIYVTFAAALTVATVRALNREGRQDRTLIGALAFIAVFGLASGSYYVGRSHPEVLVTSFAAWSFALALLTVVAVRRLAARPSRWPEPAVAGCLVAFCVTACSLAQTPTPWSQVKRLRDTSPVSFHSPSGEDFVAAHVHRGERVAILQMLGHRIGTNLGVVDVAPYTGQASMPAYEQLVDTIRILRAEGGKKVFIMIGGAELPDVRPALQAAGFGPTAQDHEGDQLWVYGAHAGGLGEAP